MNELNQRGAGKGGIGPLLHTARAWPALPDPTLGG